MILRTGNDACFSDSHPLLGISARNDQTLDSRNGTFGDPERKTDPISDRLRLFEAPSTKLRAALALLKRKRAGAMGKHCRSFPAVEILGQCTLHCGLDPSRSASSENRLCIHSPLQAENTCGTISKIPYQISFFADRQKQPTPANMKLLENDCHLKQIPATRFRALDVNKIAYYSSDAG